MAEVDTIVLRSDTAHTDESWPRSKRATKRLRLEEHSVRLASVKQQSAEPACVANSNTKTASKRVIQHNSCYSLCAASSAKKTTEGQATTCCESGKA